MKCLLDSHAMLWHRNGDARLSQTASDLIEDTSVDLLVSEVSFWEISVKLSMGKLQLIGGLASLREEWIGQSAARSLQLEWKHILAVSSLPWVHKDPFDRMLVAQALAEDLAIITADPNIPKYPGIRVLW